MSNSWGNAWGEDVQRPEQQPVAQVDSGAPNQSYPDDFNDSPEFSGANAGDVPYDPFAAAAAHAPDFSANDQNVGRPVQGGAHDIPLLDPSITGTPAGLGPNNTPKPFDRGQDQYAANSFDTSPTPGQVNPPLNVRPVQQYHDQLMDEIVNGNLNAQLQDDGTWIIQPTTQTDNGTPQTPADADMANAMQGVQTVQGALQKLPGQLQGIDQLNDQNQPSLVPTDQDMNTPGVNHPNTLLGKLEPGRYNPNDPTAGNVAPDAASKLLEATAVALPAIALSEVAMNPELNLSAGANIFGKTFSVSTNGLAKWAADMALRTGVAQVVGTEADKLNLPAPVQDVLGFFPYTVGSSGLLGAVENAGVLAGAVAAARKSGLPEGPSIPIVGNARDFVAMFLAGGFKGHLDEHIKAGEAAQTGVAPEKPTATVDELVANGFSRSAAEVEVRKQATAKGLLPTSEQLGLSDYVANQLNIAQQAVINAAPEDMVTVYHGTDGQSAENIHLNGLAKDSRLTTDPEMAALHTMNRGSTNPTVLSFTVPRASLEERGPFFQTNEVLQSNVTYLDRPPQAAVRGWLADVQPGMMHDLPVAAGVSYTGGEPVHGTARMFYGADEAGILTDKVNAVSGLSSGKGWIGPDGQAYAIKGNDIHAGTTTHGVDQALDAGWTRIEKDANGVYIHAPDMSSVENALRGSERKTGDLDVDIKLPGGKTASFHGKLSDWLNSTAKVRGSNITLTAGRTPEYSPDVFETAFGSRSSGLEGEARDRYLRSHGMQDATEKMEAQRAGLSRLSDEEVRGQYQQAMANSANSDIENPSANDRAADMRSVVQYGQELYRRTGGKEGTAPNGTAGPVDITTTSGNFENARQNASTLFATVDHLGQQINGGVTIPDVLQDYVDTHDQLLQTLSQAHQLGEDLARATKGEQGPPMAVRQAIKQFLVEEEGSLSLPKRTPEGKYTVNMGAIDPLSTTTPPQIIRTPITDRMLGVDPIVPHLSPAQRLLNLAKDLTNRGVTADPLGQAIGDQMAKSREITSSHASDLKNRAYAESRKVFKFDKDGNTVDLGPGAPSSLQVEEGALGAAAMHPGVPAVGGDVSAVTKVTINGETRYRIVKKDGSTSYFVPDKEEMPTAAKPTSIKASIQTIAADYAHWKGFLDPKQQAFMEWTRDMFNHEQVALSEMGIAPGTRPDIQPGGWYLPRGGASEVGAPGYRGPQLKNRGVKISAEMVPQFASMEEGKKAGWVYEPFHEAIGGHAEDVGRRLLDEKMRQVLQNSKDEQGRPLAMTPAALALRDPKHAAVAGQMKQLKDWMSTLDASVTNLDERSRQIMEKFIASPAVDMDDWQTMRQALDAMSTKNGQLRIRNTLAPSDLRTNFRVMRQAITQNLTVVRGQFKDLPYAAAQRLATQKTLDDLSIKRGRFKGMDAGQAQALLGNIKDAVTNLQPAYKDAIDHASRYYRQLEPTGFGAGLRDYRLPDTLADDLNAQLKAKQPAAGPFAVITDGIQAGGRLLRTLRLAGDFATMTTHGTIGLFNNPVAYGTALKTMFLSLAKPGAIGDYLNDFDVRHANDGHPKVNDWAQAGSHVGDSGTGILGLNRTYAALTTSLRLELNDAGFDPEWNKLGPADRLGKMRDLASTNNIITGYAPHSFGGSLGDTFLLAPRLIQSQIDLLGRGLNPKGGVMGVGDARRKLLTYFGVAAALTVAANESGLFPQAPGFDYLSPRKNGQWNPDFMRVATPVGKVSMFGAYDWMLKAAEAGTKGDWKYLPRTKAGPLVSDIWDLASGHDFLGHPLKLTDPKSMLPWLVSSAAPIAPSEPTAAFLRGALGSGPKVGIGQAAGQFLMSETGIKHSAPTAAVEYASLRDDTFQSMVKDGRVPQDVAAMIKDTPFNELPLGVQKQVDNEIKKQNPDDYNWYHQQRLEADNIYEQRSAAADAERNRYAGKYDSVNNMLKAGNNPYQVWTAYDSYKNELTGALKTVYDGKDAEDYKMAVANLPQSDMRRIEAGYDAIIFDHGDPETFTNADWDKIGKQQADYLTALQTAHPDLASLLQYSLAERDKLQLENAAPIVQLKKQASAMLQPYYQMVDLEKSGASAAGASQQWLANHADADYMHWLTEKPLTPDTTPKLHSPAAAAQAVAAFAGTPRVVELVGSKQPLTAQNLQITEKYAKQIIQITTLPGTATDAAGKSYSPVQRLRQSDPVYDALYTWLFAQPQKDKSGRSYVVMYHADYVNNFLASVGGRDDKVKPRTSGSASPF